MVFPPVVFFIYECVVVTVLGHNCYDFSNEPWIDVPGLTKHAEKLSPVRGGHAKGVVSKDPANFDKVGPGFAFPGVNGRKVVDTLNPAQGPKFKVSGVVKAGEKLAVSRQKFFSFAF